MDQRDKRRSGADGDGPPAQAPQAQAPQARGTTRTQDPDGTRRDILEIASQEFALNGLSGARIDEIAARTRSSKRMIYYYFGDKEGLYLRALENAYRRSEEHTSELQSLMRISYAVFCLKT